MFQGCVAESLKDRKRLVSEAGEPEECILGKDQGGENFMKNEMVTVSNVTQAK